MAKHRMEVDSKMSREFSFHRMEVGCKRLVNFLCIGWKWIASVL